MEILNNLDVLIENLLNNLGAFGPILACFLIVIESIIPILPLGVFVTLNFLSFGHIFGFLISLFFTIIGCLISFTIFRKGVYNWFNKKIKDKEKIENLMIKFSHISLGSLAAIIAMPFTPAFLVNIAAGLSDMSKKKFIIALCIGKCFMVYFWGYVGTSLIQSLTNPIIILRIVTLVFIAYIISKAINKKLKID